VKFNGVSASVTQASAIQLTVVVPVAAGTGPVTVAVGKQAFTGPVFTYIYTTTVSTLAGSGVKGFADGNGVNAQFNNPEGLTTDAQGNVYVADLQNNRIRKITPSGMVSTLAGSGVAGYLDSTAGQAQFNEPAGVVMDTQGNFFVTDQNNSRIQKITPGGLVSTLAGNGTGGTGGFADGNRMAAQFFFPLGIACDTLGNIYVADEDNDRIRKVTPSGMVSTLAGSTNSTGFGGYADGNGTAALFLAPCGVALDAQGNIYVADYINNRIRKITPSNDVSTLAGSGASAYADGNGLAAAFNGPRGIATDAQGNMYVADQANQRIRKITSSGVVSTLAGSGTGYGGYADGNATTAQFNFPTGVAVDMKGNVYVADYVNNRIRKITVQ
jgi:sugar lactone lactonase YvrE